MAKTSHAHPFKHFIGGDWVDSKDGAVFDILNPLDDSIYGQAAKGADVDIRSAVSAAKAAFPTYRATLPMERERMLLRVAEIMERRQAARTSCQTRQAIGPAHGPGLRSVWRCQLDDLPLLQP